MSKNKTVSYLFYAAAIICYVCAFVWYFLNADHVLGVAWLCIGSAFLLNGRTWTDRSKSTGNR